MIKKFYFLLLVLFLCSCSFLSKKIESLVDISENKTPEVLSKNKKALHCFENNKVQMLLEDESTFKYYHPFIPQLFEGKNYSFIQKAVMLSLIEMSRRPDEASPSARLQYFLHLNKKSYYLDFSSLNHDENFRMPFLKGLEYLVKNFDQSKSLAKLAEILDLTVPQSLNVSPEFENFLQLYKSELIKKDPFSEVFFKGDEVLTKHESFKRISFKKIINLFNNDKSNQDPYFTISRNSLVSMDIGQNNLPVNCNADINKENNLADDLLNSTQKKSHYFAIKDGDNYFIALSSALLEKPLKNIKDTYLLSTKSPIAPLPVCQFFNKDEDIVLFSTSGRNPIQHLKHLVTYDIGLVSSYQSLEEILNFSRHLFLTSPDRILYESKRGRKSQLDFFLSMNFPIYHVENLGDLVGAASFYNHGRADRSLIIDDRSSAKLWCSP